MKKIYQKPQITMMIVALEEGIASSSCKGAHQGLGHGNGKGCKADHIMNSSWEQDDDLTYNVDF